MSYTQETLDAMTLVERVNLASQGEISWGEVNRPEADEQRAKNAELAIPLSTRLRRTPLVRSNSQYLRRRHVRLHAYREERARVERLLIECRLEAAAQKVGAA